eukprot:4830962-Lingulodinium_polyedra.AAC.1
MRLAPATRPAARLRPRLPAPLSARPVRGLTPAPARPSVGARVAVPAWERRSTWAGPAALVTGAGPG